LLNVSMNGKPAIRIELKIHFFPCFVLCFG
jgi:hypothetical protein